MFFENKEKIGKKYEESHDKGENIIFYKTYFCSDYYKIAQRYWYLHNSEYS